MSALTLKELTEERDRLLVELAEANEERERFRQHSIKLNTIAWRIAEGLGEVPPGADRIEGDPTEQAERLIAKCDRLWNQCAFAESERNELRDQLASMTAQRDSARDAHDAALKRIDELEEQNDGLNNDLIMMRAKRPALYALADAAKAYSQVSHALEHFKGSTDELGALADAHSLARYAVRAAVDKLAAETSAGVGTSGAGSNEDGRSVAPSVSSDESDSTDEVKLLRAQRATLLSLLTHIDGVGDRHNGPYPQAAWVSSDTIRDILSDENAASATEETIRFLRARVNELEEQAAQRTLAAAAAGAGQAGEEVDDV